MLYLASNFSLSSDPEKLGIIHELVVSREGRKGRLLVKEGSPEEGKKVYEANNSIAVDKLGLLYLGRESLLPPFLRKVRNYV